MTPHATRRGEQSNALSKMAGINPAPSAPESRFFTGAVHISESHITVGVVDADHRVVIRARCAINGAPSYADLLRTIPAMLARLARTERVKVSGIGIACAPGMHSSKENCGYFLTWRQRNFLKRSLEDRFQVRVAMENDFYALALSEAKWGAQQGHSRVLYVDVGMRVVRPALIDRTNLDKAGHPLVQLDSSGYCERWASLVSEDSMVVWFKRNAPRYRNQSISTKEILTLAIRGQVSAQRASVRESINLARGLADLIKIHRSTAVVLGGRVFEEVPDLINAIRHVIDSCLLVPQGPVELAVASFGTNSNLVGAAALWCPRLATKVDGE